MHVDWQTAYRGSNLTYDGLEAAHLHGIVPGLVPYRESECRAVVIVPDQDHIGSPTLKEALRLQPLAECLCLGLGRRTFIKDSVAPAEKYFADC